MKPIFDKYQPVYFDKSKNWWLWDFDLKKWNLVDETDILIKIDAIFNFPGTTRSGQKQEILEILRRVGRMSKPRDPPKTWIQFKDIIIDVESGDLIVPTPDYFIVNPIPYAVGMEDKTPIMDKIFTAWVGEKHVTLLYEIIAYCLLADYPLARIFCLCGSGRNGKSTYLKLIERFLGNENVCSTELDYIIENRFETAKLYKKLVCVMGETNFTAIKKTSILKRLVGGDLVGFEFKNKMPFDDYNYSKIIISTNSLPVTYDKTEGFYRRWVLIDFPNKFQDKRDILADIPDIEYNNLARKCIKLLHGILKKREFTNEGSVEERRQRYEEKSNPLMAFLNEMCEFDERYEESSTEVYAVFKDYLRERGYREISQRAMSQQIKAEGYIIKGINVGSGKDRTKIQYIIGLKFKQKKEKGQQKLSEESENEELELDEDQVSPTSSPIALNESSSSNTSSYSRQNSIDFLIEYIENFPDGVSAVMVDEYFDKKLVEKALREGIIMENPLGMYRLVK